MKATSDVTDVITPAEIGEFQGASAVLRSKNGFAASLMEVVGAILLGVILLGGTGVAIGAAINSGRDGQAKSSLDAVKSAQIVQQSKTQAYGTYEALTTGADPAMTKTAENIKVNATATNYCAGVKSTSLTGPTYWITARNATPVETMPTDAGLACPTF